MQAWRSPEMAARIKSLKPLANPTEYSREAPKSINSTYCRVLVKKFVGHMSVEEAIANLLSLVIPKEVAPVGIRLHESELEQLSEC